MKKHRNFMRLLLVVMGAALLLGCGWDSTPKLYIPTPAPTEAPTPERATPVRTLAPGETPDPNATDTPEPSETPDPNATPGPEATPDAYLIGLWSYTFSTYKGTTITAKQAGHTIDIRFFKDGSAATEFDGESTTGLKYTLRGAQLTITVSGATWLTLLYDGTYLIWEQEVDGAYADSFFERTKD